MHNAYVVPAGGAPRPSLQKRVQRGLLPGRQERTSRHAHDPGDQARNVHASERHDAVGLFHFFVLATAS